MTENLIARLYHHARRFNLEPHGTIDIHDLVNEAAIVVLERGATYDCIYRAMIDALRRWNHDRQSRPRTGIFKRGNGGAELAKGAVQFSRADETHSRGSNRGERA